MKRLKDIDPFVDLEQRFPEHFKQLKEIEKKKEELDKERRKILKDIISIDS